MRITGFWVLGLWALAAVCLVSVPAGADLVTVSGTLSGTAEADDGRFTTISEPVGFGLTTLDLDGPVDFGSQTVVDQSLDASGLGLVLTGTAVSVSEGSNKSTNGAMRNAILFTVDEAGLYRFDLDLSYGPNTETLISIGGDHSTAALFSFTGDGLSGDRTFDDTFLLTPGTEYFLNVSLDVSVDGGPAPVSATTAYTLGITLVPEPGASAVFALGVVGVCVRRRQRAA
ncbi:MAG: PEP-CTERM sorting domain-containing protein [Planctomycetota bacterium]